MSRDGLLLWAASLLLGIKADVASSDVWTVVFSLLAIIVAALAILQFMGVKVVES